MIAITKILVPTDFSDASEAALQYGRELAERFGASLHVLHVIQDPFTMPWAAEGLPVALGELLDEWQRGAWKRLHELVPDAAEKGITVTTRIGSPFQEILSHAEEEGIDLVVMGTHGRGAVTHALMGSVAEKMVRKAPCPVLTVRSRVAKEAAPLVAPAAAAAQA
jgi:nucleotide-binding universal stress UspA family protein